MRTEFVSNAPVLRDMGASNHPGEIYIANEARFTAATYSEPLTAYVQGWKDPDLEALLQFLAPRVPIGRRFEFKSGTNKEFFLTETDDSDIRPIGSAFKRVEYTGSTTLGKTFNKGLTIRVDEDEAFGDGWRERFAGMLKRRLLRMEVYRANALLIAGATGTTPAWTYNASTNPNPNPDNDFRSALGLATDASGIRPNRIAIGEGQWDLRAASYEALNTPHAGRAANMTADELGRKLMVDRIQVVSARYQSSAVAKSKLVPGCILFLAEDNLMKDDPSNIKRFVTPTDAGDFKVYVEEHPKFTDITVEHYSNIVVTSTTGLRKIVAT